MSTKQKGIFYGYPECCISEFIQIKPNKRTRAQRMAQRIYKYSGFIPCHDCSNKILEGKETFESLIKHRICRHEFPKGKHMRQCRIKKF